MKRCVAERCDGDDSTLASHWDGLEFKQISRLSEAFVTIKGTAEVYFTRYSFASLWQLLISVMREVPFGCLDKELRFRCVMWVL